LKRKQALRDLMDENSYQEFHENSIEAPIVYSEHLIGDGQEMLEHAAKLNWEGIISKRAAPRIDRSGPKPGLKSKPSRRGNSRSSDL
jgi:bifunctional non-homologous end joining protein LigD